MSLIRVFAEVGLLWLSASAGILAWGPSFPWGWGDFLTALAQAMAPSICCAVSFYYNGLYDLRIVHSFRAFTLRVPQAFGVAFILLAACYMLLPGARMTNG